MELASRRESSLQRRAAAAVSAANAASCADDLMEEMLEEAAGSGTGGSVGALTVEPNTTELNSGGMLDALGPVGPPLSFSPGQPPMLVERAKGMQNLEVKQNVENTPGVKRVVVTEQQTRNPPNEGTGTTTESVQGIVNEHSPRDGAGKGKGSSSESGRREPRQTVAAEAQHSNRDVQSSRVRGSEGVENVSQDSRMRGSVCETVSQDSRMRGFGRENVSQSSHVRGSEGCETVSQGSRMRSSVCENVSQGSHVRGSEGCETVSQGSRMRSSVCENVSQGSHVRGSEGCETVSQDSRTRGFGCENVSQGSHVRGSEGCQNVSPGPTGKGSGVVSETMPQGPNVKGSGVQRFYIGDGPQGSGAVVVAPQGTENVVVVPDQMGSVVNPFWSETQQREAVREAFGPGYDVSALGLQPGSNASTPQKVHVEQRESVDVEMDPIELFRLRCLRDAEEKFRQGLLNMGMSAKESRVEKHEHEKGSHGSQSSYVSAVDFQEPVAPKSHDVVESQMVHDPYVRVVPEKAVTFTRVAPENVVSTVSNVVEPFVPRPPPGPPPPSPPRMLNSVCGLGSVTPQFPPALPPFPVSVAGNLQNSGGENPSENLRTVELPKLSMDATALQFGDWLSIIDSLMGDLSYSSGDWWTMVRGAVDQCYRDWLNVGPIERLRLRPQVDPRVQLWPRTERRALAMLLGAIPDPIKEEVISARKLTTDQVLYKLCITFQPGGATERTKLLQNITDSKCGSNVHEVLDWIRTWRRFVQSARELHVTLPDGLVLLGALNKCTDVLSGKSPQVAYRLNMIRQQLNVDQLPTAETILSYSEHLQAEAEELTLSAPAKATSAVRAAALGVPLPPGIPQNPQSSPKPQNESDPRFPNSKRKPCRYWMSEKGCTRGDQCSFGHANLDPQSNRCFNCSAVGHSKRDCPLKNTGSDPKHDPTKKRVAKVSKPSGKGTPEKSGKGSGEHSSPEKTTGDVAAAEKPLGSETAYRTGPETGDGGESTPERVTGLLSEATTLLKTLKPVAKAVKIKRVNAPDGPTGLLDGGATNALRRGTPKELAEADPVVVELAHGSVELKQHALTGTILTEHAVEPIVPLRGLIDLGFVIKWSTHGCEIKHPSRGTIQCWLRNGCPVVSEKHALGLIHDIESLELAKRIPSESPETVSETAHEWWSQRFPNVPKRIWRYMKGQGVETPGVHLPWESCPKASTCPS